MPFTITAPKKVFGTIWTTQFFSSLGTGLTDFALGVFVYQRTGSTSQFALVLVCAMVPAILLSPFSGVLGDRADRRLMMLGSNAASGAVVLVLLLLRHGGHLDTWHIYAGAAVLAICGAFRDPAYYASVSQMVPKEQLGRASGAVQTAENIGIVAPPVVAGVLLSTVGLSGILLLDLITYGLGVLALMATVFPPVERGDAPAGKPSLFSDMAEGWRYVLAYRGLLYLFFFGAFISFTVGLTQIVVTPLVLAFASTSVLGATFSAGGVGIFLGGLVMTMWGGPRNRVAGILLFGLGQALSLVVAGLRPNAVLIGIGLFGCLFGIQFVRGGTATVIRTYVPDSMQARVFSLNRFVAWSTLPLAYLLAGPLVDAFDPLVKPSGSLADSVGQVIGTGKGRGGGLLLMVLGTAFLLVVLAAYLTPRFRNVETEMAAVAAGREKAAEEATEETAEEATEGAAPGDGALPEEEGAEPELAGSRRPDPAAGSEAAR
ncbi:MFS transporter [Streptomyces sp. NPDC021020]|uniref:MFS transporter n=1 Tax=Streptomyces sp. NPDC021020 TaxID=3365109 RepID=UPI00379F78A6